MGCYICGGATTSVEHAPAKSFFPKLARTKLITVRSCAEHNEATSTDDEYVRNIIAMCLGNNGNALTHFLDKCIRSLNLSPGLAKVTLGHSKPVYVEEKGTDKLQPSFAVKLDRDRIDKVLRKIGYALFYYEYDKCWDRKLKIGTEYLVYEDFQHDDLGLLIKEARKELQSIGSPVPEFKGANPHIFKYAFLKGESENEFDQVLRMIFYEGFEAWLLPAPGSNGPVWE